MAVSYYENIDFSLFETEDFNVSESTVRVQAKERPAQKNIKALKKSKKQLKQEMHMSGKRVVALVLLCVLLFAPICSFVYARVQLDSISRSINATKKDIEDEKSEKIRLDAEIGSMMTIDRIEQYAEGVLGMVKVGSYHVDFCDFSGEDKVLLSGGRSYDALEETSFFSKLLSYIL